jgi:hypothetical protein
MDAIAVPYPREKVGQDYRRDDLEPPANLAALSGAALSDVVAKRISVYQGIRYFAQTERGHRYCHLWSLWHVGAAGPLRSAWIGSVSVA